ncbi:mitogen-activated protein kinase kinase kinase 5-like isoform X8 [Mercenaria mercenaria]|uniref:mitogen-activated protein kinase kinase kinase 5-like isoform X8 n=1 Tax=Mercenaria mercenaria TaxID=6596 RepID=UPI00234EB540|nr:mitogen-activated protein kinase kinase kinase 5-like isoform X8 [Mercenaria mercenaria]
MKVVSVVDVTTPGVTAPGVTPDPKNVNPITLLTNRKNALEQIDKACKSIEATLENIQFQKLDFGETQILDTFYNADVVIVDMTIATQQSSLFYHVGVRQSMGMKYNVVIANDTDPELTVSLRLSCGPGVVFFPYTKDASGVIIVQDGTVAYTDVCVHPETGPSLLNKLKKFLSDVDDESVTHLKERFLADLRKARDNYKGEDLVKALHGMKRRLDDPQLLSVDVVVNLLISFREIQDYNSMVKLVEDLDTIPNLKISCTVAVQNLYAFALNRRNKNGDRTKALSVILKVIETTENPVPDLLCLAGRIYKDKFVEADYEDKSALENAIVWYRKGFEIQPNEYAGINLATLLVISGKEFSTCSELKRIGLKLNNLIGKKGSLQTLTDYWDVATFFEISVLAQDYGKAVQAAECMFKLEPPYWYLKSTLGNIQLINKFRKPSTHTNQETQLFNFWMEFFMEATKSEVSPLWYPVLILEPNKVFVPSYLQVNMDEDNKSVHIYNVCRSEKLQHEWVFPVPAIKGVSLYKRDVRAVFLYVVDNSDDFHIFFSSEMQRQLFYDDMCKLIKEHQRGFEAELEERDNIELLKTLQSDFLILPTIYEYETDEKGNRVVLGRGSYGVVYAARDNRTQVKVAVKEVPEKFHEEVQPLHEEIKLHSRLSNKNIVKYLGSLSEDGFFKIFMEQVPGGSLSQLLSSKWGPLKDNEPTIAFYTKQILDGLKYLHDNRIVHRDIKGDNVLVNTYSGILKISDFGTSKRLAGINPCAETFAGTMQYMAPEVIDRGMRGYGPPADIWSLGCTVIEMATGKPPFIELGSAEAAMFKVGFYKMHPEIPDSLSDIAKDFLLKCFAPEPEKRFTAQQLLEHPFIKETLAPKKKRKKMTEVEYLRSTSVPASSIASRRTDMTMKLKLPQKSGPASVVARNTIGFSGSMENILDDIDTVQEERTGQKGHNRSQSVHTFGGLDYDTRPKSFRKRAESDGTLVHAEATESFQETAKRSRSPSPTLTSPGPQSPTLGFSISMNEVIQDSDGTHSGTGSHDSQSREGFYMLRKDSERRTTLVLMLSKESDFQRVVETWMELIHRDATISHPKLGKEHLSVLLKALTEYIRDQNSLVIKDALDEVKMKLEYDHTALMELQLALYVFQEAVSINMRLRDIQPHWMFALDNLLRNATQAAITVLSPELGANLAGDADDRDMGTSGVPSTTSGKSATGVYRKSVNMEIRNQLESSEDENLTLLQQLLEVQRAYNELLKKSITEKKLQMEVLQQALSGQGIIGASSSGSTPVTPAVVINEPPDEQLIQWLRQCRIDSGSIDQILNEQYTLDDLLEYVTLEQLQRLNIKGGIVCRIWRAIQAHRAKHKKVKR